MQNLLIYIFEVSVLTSIFFLFYRYLYFKLAYFVWSRYYFYLILFASLIIPLLPSMFNAESVLLKIENLIGITANGNNAFVNVKDSFLLGQNSFFSGIPIVEIVFIIWVSGFIRYIFFILKSVVSIIRLINKGEKKEDGDFTIVRTNTDNPAFSFFNYIFTNISFSKLQEVEQKQIIKHEKIHAKQKHTIDNIIFEIFRAVFWFNPVSKLISVNVKIIHEFIVDNELTGNKNIPDYSRLIVKLAAQKSQGLMVSSFSKEEITSRIKLITFPETEKIRKKRFAISIPVLIITMFASWMIISTINVYALNKEDVKKEFHKPFKKNSYKIISPFFENKKVDDLFISHKEVSYELKSFSDIYSVETGIIINIEEKDIFGLKEYTVSEELQNGYLIKYKGIYKVKVNVGEKIEKGKLIGIAGDIRLYPKIDIQIIENGKSINPETLY